MSLPITVLVIFDCPIHSDGVLDHFIIHPCVLEIRNYKLGLVIVTTNFFIAQLITVGIREYPWTSGHWYLYLTGHDCTEIVLERRSIRWI